MFLPLETNAVCHVILWTCFTRCATLPCLQCIFHSVCDVNMPSTCARCKHVLSNMSIAHRVLPLFNRGRTWESMINGFLPRADRFSSFPSNTYPVNCFLMLRAVPCISECIILLISIPSISPFLACDWSCSREWALFHSFNRTTNELCFRFPPYWPTRNVYVMIGSQLQHNVRPWLANSIANYPNSYTYFPSYYHRQYCIKGLLRTCSSDPYW